MLNTVIGLLLFVVFLFLSGLHLYWAAGGRWARQVVFPTKEDKTKAPMPGTGPTLVVAVGLLAISLFILRKTALVSWSIPGWLDHYGLWLIAGIFLLRAIGDFTYVGFFKRIKHTPFGKNDTTYYSPLSLGIGVLTLAMALNT